MQESLSNPGFLAIEVMRLGPTSSQRGHLKTFYPPITVPDIIEKVMEEYGGGEYQICIFDVNGKCLKTKKFEISGAPRPLISNDCISISDRALKGESMTRGSIVMGSQGPPGPSGPPGLPCNCSGKLSQIEGGLQTMVDRLQVLEEKNKIVAGSHVWSKATNQGPWVALSPAELEVGLHTTNEPKNLHEIPRVPGWIVRDAEGKDRILPTAELVPFDPKPPAPVKTPRVFTITNIIYFILAVLVTILLLI